MNTPARGETGSPLPWDIVQSGVSQSYFEYELRLAQRSETGLSCPAGQRRLSELPGVRCGVGVSVRRERGEAGACSEGRAVACTGLAAVDSTAATRPGG